MWGQVVFANKLVSERLRLALDRRLMVVAVHRDVNANMAIAGTEPASELYVNFHSVRRKEAERTFVRVADVRRFSRPFELLVGVLAFRGKIVFVDGTDEFDAIGCGMKDRRDRTRK